MDNTFDWTMEEDATLVSMHGSGGNLLEMTQTLNRSPLAIGFRMRKYIPLSKLIRQDELNKVMSLKSAKTSLEKRVAQLEWQVLSLRKELAETQSLLMVQPAFDTDARSETFVNDTASNSGDTETTFSDWSTDFDV